MKRVFVLLLAAVLLLSLCACGNGQQNASEVEIKEDISNSETTPRDYFKFIQGKMDELEEKREGWGASGDTTPPATNPPAKDSDGATTPPATGGNTGPKTYTTNGLTYTLEGDFQPLTHREDNFQHMFTNGTITVIAQIYTNYYDLYTSQALAEEFASGHSTRTVGQLNGVYYVEDTASKTITAYYVDNSGFFRMMCANCQQFAANKTEMIQICTSATLN